MTEEFYTLKEAAGMLGVHTGTLRRWAQDGKVEVVRTPGGHRRFPSAEIDRIRYSGGPEETEKVSDRLQQLALSSTRADLRHEHGTWAEGLTEMDREEKRLLGRRLLGLLMQYVALNNGEGEDILDEARVVSRIYARSVVQSGVVLKDALRATMFFRDHIIESAVVLPEAAGRRPEANQKMFRRLNAFLNEVQIVIADAYGTKLDR